MAIDEAIQQARYVADEHSDCWRNCENIEKCCKECEYEHEVTDEAVKQLLFCIDSKMDKYRDKGAMKNE